MQKLTLLTDQAIGEGDILEQDGLGFGTYAQVLGDAALGTEGPFTIGVFGEWGTGKTSLMKMIQDYLSNQSDVVTVWFNAWRFEKEEHPIVPLVATIVQELERNRDLLQKLEDGGKSLITALRAIAYGFSATSKVKVPGFAEIEASFVAKDMIDRSDKLSPDPLLDRSLYFNSFDRLSRIEIGRKAKIVVLIDDLDRCFPDLAIKLLESIKLVLSQPGFVYVLGVARSVIEGYLQHRYETEYGLKNFQGHYYLDKIVQLSFYIPPHHDRMEDFLKSLLKRIDEKDREAFQEILPIIGVVSGSNPRTTIRFVNNLLIDRAINAVLARTETMEVIQLEYFALTRSLQQRWREVFSILASTDDLCQAITQWHRDELVKYASSEDQDEIKIAKRMISDRNLQELLFSKHGRAWLENKQIRRATIQFLRTQRQEIIEDGKHLEKEFDVFLSYSHKDREEVSKVAKILTDNGVKVFLDTQIMPGQVFANVIRSAIAGSRAVAFFLSEKTIGSRWIGQEITLVSDMVKKGELFLILPVLMGEFDDALLPVELADVQWLDLRGKEINLQTLQPLITVLRSKPK